MQKIKILMITGWGLGTKPLEALKSTIDHAGYEIKLIDIFNALDPNEFSKKIELAKNFDVIMGWSLGGQLATLLTHKIFEMTGQYKTLITLASNPCFVANESWEDGMPVSTFQNFKESFLNDPMLTLKRFSYLVTQGSLQAKQDWQWLQNCISSENLELKSEGLEMLHRLNTVEMIKNYAGRQFHFFAEDDGIVSHKIIEKIRKFDAKFLKVESIVGSHCFSIFKSIGLNERILQYLKKIDESL